MIFCYLEYNSCEIIFCNVYSKYSFAIVHSVLAISLVFFKFLYPLKQYKSFSNYYANSGPGGNNICSFIRCWRLYLLLLIIYNNRFRCEKYCTILRGEYFFKSVKLCPDLYA